MQLLQQLLAAELNASAFGSRAEQRIVIRCLGGRVLRHANKPPQIKNAQQQAASFNSRVTARTFTPGTSADSKNARAIANLAFWDVLP